jgi:hypothetical protein
MTHTKTPIVLSDEQVQLLADAAYGDVLATFATDSAKHVIAWHAAHAAALRAYPADTFCVARDTPAHKAIRQQARNAANAAGDGRKGA